MASLFEFYDICFSSVQPSKHTFFILKLLKLAVFLRAGDVLVTLNLPLLYWLFGAMPSLLVCMYFHPVYCPSLFRQATHDTDSACLAP